MSDSGIQFGLVLDVNGTRVALEPTDVVQKTDEIAKNGFSYQLNKPVDIGTMTNLTGSISSLFGVAISLPDTSSWPDPLNHIGKFIENLNITIEEFSLFIPGSSSASGSTSKFTIALSAVSQNSSDELNLFGSINLQGIYIKFSGEGSHSTT